MARRPSTAKPDTRVRFLKRLDIEDLGDEKPATYPLDLPIVRELHIEFKTPLTFFVGENGCGKSTLLEAIADLCRLPIQGGGRTELDDSPTSNAAVGPGACLATELPRAPLGRLLRSRREPGATGRLTRGK